MGVICNPVSQSSTLRGLVALMVVLTIPAIALADVTGPARVIDGDTLDVQGQRIRLHGIDAPESRQLCFIDGRRWQCGKEAANILMDFIKNRPVRCEDLGRDRYTRIGGRVPTPSVTFPLWKLASLRRGFSFALDRALMCAWTRIWRTSSASQPPMAVSLDHTLAVARARVSGSNAGMDWMWP